MSVSPFDNSSYYRHCFSNWLVKVLWLLVKVNGCMDGWENGERYDMGRTDELQIIGMAYKEGIM